MECTPRGSDKIELLDLGLLAAPKRFAPLSLRKQLAELFVLSKLDYCNCLYGSLPEYLLKRLQKVQNAAAGFVTGKLAKVNDVITLGWLPIKERIEFSLSKLAYKALKDDKGPGYLSLQIKKATRVLRSNTDGALKLEHSSIEDSFQYNAAKVFNSLPENLKSLDFKNNKSFLKSILLERRKERTK